MHPLRRALPFLATGVLVSGGLGGSIAQAHSTNQSPQACVTKQLRVHGYWTFKHTHNGSGPMQAIGHVKLSNAANGACTLSKSWPQIHLMNKQGHMLKAQQNDVDAAGAYPPPIKLKGKQKEKWTILFHWSNWCKAKPAKPIVVGYTAPNSKMKRFKLGLGKQFHAFHVPGCSQGSNPSTIKVWPYEPPVGAPLHY